jgi:hypothetical protein
MKNRLLTGILFIILGGLIAIGPQTIFPVCEVHMAGPASMSIPAGTVMKCHWAARAELGVGFLIGLIGVFLIIFQSRQIRLGLSLALILNGILALLIPTALIGVCSSAHMTCRSLTLPALIIISSVIIVASAANVLYLHNFNRKGQVRS